MFALYTEYVGSMHTLGLLQRDDALEERAHIKFWHRDILFGRLHQAAEAGFPCNRVSLFLRLLLLWTCTCVDRVWRGRRGSSDGIHVDEDGGPVP